MRRPSSGVAKRCQLAGLAGDMAIAVSASDLGLTLWGETKYAESAEQFEHALAIRQKTGVPNDPDLAANYNNLGATYLLPFLPFGLGPKQTVIAEAGPDLHDCASEKRFTSWLGLTPTNEKSGGQDPQPQNAQGRQPGDGVVSQCGFDIRHGNGR
jgi:Tetratricopeptide repeat/Transposase IS116/IS110/IS902 family